MRTTQRVEINGRTLFVAFISSYQGESDYGVSHRGGEAGRVRVVWPADADAPNAREIRMENDVDKARRFAADYGFPWSDACAAVRQAIAKQFDDDVRWLAERNMLEHASGQIRTRARELMSAQTGETSATV